MWFGYELVKNENLILIFYSKFLILSPSAGIENVQLAPETIVYSLRIIYYISTCMILECFNIVYILSIELDEKTLNAKLRFIF